MHVRAPFAFFLVTVLGACTAPDAPKTEAEAGKAEVQAEPGKVEVKAPAKPEGPPLSLEPSADIKYDPPFNGQPVATRKTESGITIEDFVVGDGVEAVKGGEVDVHYTGYLTDGTVFDTSKKRNRPFSFPLGEGRVIKGWDEGVVGMKVGGKRRLVVPAVLGYGERRAGKIPPGATLVFAIELLSYTPPPPPPQPLSVFEAKPLTTKKLEDGLVVHEFKVGEGAEAKAGDVVAVHYRGTLKDGTEFDSSLARKAISFPLGQGRVIKGWDLGVAGMKVGGLRKLEVPAKLGYGERAKGKIPANSDLIFTVELMSVKTPPAPPPGAALPPGVAPGQHPTTPGTATPGAAGAKPGAPIAPGQHPTTPAKAPIDNKVPAENKAGVSSPSGAPRRLAPWALAVSVGLSCRTGPSEQAPVAAAPAVTPAVAAPEDMPAGAAEKEARAAGSALSVPEDMPVKTGTEGAAAAAKAPADPPPAGAPEVIACLDPPPAGMACVPAGWFIRGSDSGPEHARPQARVWLQTYYLDLHEATYAEYKACVKTRGCDPRGGPAYSDFDRPKQPINGVSWFHADIYCKAHGKRLPSEAQWEKGARGPDGDMHPWGDEPATCERAILKDASGRGCGVKKLGSKPDTGRPWEVGARAPGRYGLYDMSGNSWEWVADWFSRSYAECGADCEGVDPLGPCAERAGAGQPGKVASACAGRLRKIVRGGSWYWDASYATGVWRRPHFPTNQPFHHFGFRCAASPAEADRLRGG